MMRKHVKLIAILILILINISAIVFADEIHQKNGTIIKGKIIKVTSNTVEYNSKNNILLQKISIEKVSKIVYSNGATVDLSENDLKEPELNKKEKYLKSYIVSGLSLGTPGGLNLMIGYYTKWVGFHISGMYWGNDSIYGVQANFLFNFYNTSTTLHSISIAGGLLHIGTSEVTADPSDWKYGAVAYNLNYHGFYLEVGISIGSGSAKNPQGIIQIGYLIRFNTL